MKTEDFDRLKAICEQEGLYFDFDPISTTAVVATRIKPFKAVYCDWNYADNGMEVNLTFKISNWDKAKDKDDIGEYIAEQLNKYLNERPD